MAQIYQPLQMAGTDPPRYRLVSFSDEDSTPRYWPMCDCPKGHSRPEKARDCPQAAKKMDKIFPPAAGPAFSKAEVRNLIRLVKVTNADPRAIALLEQAEALAPEAA